MDHEELEQIPWSALVAEVDDRPDRRWIWLAVVAGLALVGFMLVRLGHSGGQPVAEPVPTSAVPIADTTVPEEGVVVSEADLRTDHPTGHTPIDGAGDAMAAVARAEWFVVDWHTSDGSDSIDESVLLALAPGIHVERPTDQARSTFVEWARASEIVASESGLRVLVLYRQIVTSDGEEWVRLPVRAASVDVVFVDGVPLAAGAPKLVDMDWPGFG